MRTHTQRVPDVQGQCKRLPSLVPELQGGAEHSCCPQYASWLGQGLEAVRAKSPCPRDVTPGKLPIHPSISLVPPLGPAFSPPPPPWWLSKTVDSLHGRQRMALWGSSSHQSSCAPWEPPLVEAQRTLPLCLGWA